MDGREERREGELRWSRPISEILGPTRVSNKEGPKKRLRNPDAPPRERTCEGPVVRPYGQDRKYCTPTYTDGRHNRHGVGDEKLMPHLSNTQGHEG